MSKELFTVIYSFMGCQLNLSGITKEVFSFIFGLWLKKQAPVYASITTLMNLTGAARSSVQLAIKNLQIKGFIAANKTPGKRTMYDISIPQKDLIEILSILEVPPARKSGETPPENRTTTGPKFGNQNKKRRNNNLEVPNLSEMTTGNLNEL